jgi:hypothetical protein
MEHIIGYAQPMVVSAGENVAIKVSCSSKTYWSQLLRLGIGVKCPNGPDIDHVALPSTTNGLHRGRTQCTRSGSFAKVDDFPTLVRNIKDVRFSFTFLATTLTKRHPQEYSTLFSSIDQLQTMGVACGLSQSGEVLLFHAESADYSRIHTSINVETGRWYSVHLDYLSSSQSIVLKIETCTDHGKPRWQRTCQKKMSAVKISFRAPLMIAADHSRHSPDSEPQQNNCFNGKMDGFTVSAVGERDNLLKIDFSQNMQQSWLTCAGGSGAHVVLTNSPRRATRGHDWSSGEIDWTKAKNGFGAIWFCDDDVTDVCWSTDFTVSLPVDLLSGPYSVLVRDTDHGTEDHVTFFVRPNEKNRIGLIMSTFTYLGEFAKREICAMLTCSS